MITQLFKADRHQRPVGQRMVLIVVRDLDDGVAWLVAQVVIIDQVERLAHDAVDPFGRRLVDQRDTQALVMIDQSRRP